MSQPSDIETKLREALDGEVLKALIAIAEGYSVRGEADRFVIVENPKFKEDDGSDPHICIDTFELRDAARHRTDTIAALRRQVSDAVGESHQRHVDWNELVLDAERDFTAIVDAHMPGLARRLAREALERIRAAKPTLATLTGGKADA